MPDRRFLSLLDEPDIEEVLHRAEDLLARSRGRIELSPPPPPPVDLPTLTELDAEIDEEQAAARRAEAAMEARNVRVELLAELAPVLERLVEARVLEHLGPLAASIAESVKGQLEREIKFIVRDAIDQALLSEIERVESTRRAI
jgi:hypothetical protein